MQVQFGCKGLLSLLLVTREGHTNQNKKHVVDNAPLPKRTLIFVPTVHKKTHCPLVVINGAIWDDLDQNFQIFNH